MDSRPPFLHTFDSLAQEITNYRRFLKENPYNDDDDTGVQQRARVKKILDNVGARLDPAAKHVTILLNNHRDWINSLDNKDQDKFDKLEREIKETSKYFEYQSTAAGLDPSTSIDEHGNPDTDPGQGSLKYINKLADALNVVIGYLKRREDDSDVEDDSDDPLLAELRFRAAVAAAEARIDGGAGGARRKTKRRKTKRRKKKGTRRRKKKGTRRRKKRHQK